MIEKLRELDRVVPERAIGPYGLPPTAEDWPEMAEAEFAEAWQAIGRAFRIISRARLREQAGALRLHHVAAGRCAVKDGRFFAALEEAKP